MNKQSAWKYPPISLLDNSLRKKADRGDLLGYVRIIENALKRFGIKAKVAEVNLGPQVTQYALKLELGITYQINEDSVPKIETSPDEVDKKPSVTSISEIISHANDLAFALKPPGGQIRIEAPIPGRDLVGIEIPNQSPEYITLKGILISEQMKKSKDTLSVPLGLDISGKPTISNIASMPHVLIAGTTKAEISMLINSWITSLISRTTPQEVNLILVNSKKGKLSMYEDIQHLLTPVITKPLKALSTLKWATQEMAKRYTKLEEAGCKNILSYNEKYKGKKIPYTVIIIDELVDLIAYDKAASEDSICRIAQMGRPIGIHMIIATRRSSSDVITGMIKANILTRLTFKVSSSTDSRAIIDMPGADKLLGRGDMLFVPPDRAKPYRIQSTHVTQNEVKNIVNFLRTENGSFEKRIKI